MLLAQEFRRQQLTDDMWMLCVLSAEPNPEQMLLC